MITADADTLPHRVCFFLGSHGNWGGASRVLFSTLRYLDRTKYEPIVLISQDGPARKDLEDMGVECVIWGAMTEYRSPVAYVKAILSTCHWLRKNRIAIIHMNRANDWRPAEHIAAFLCRVPIVTHFHVVNLDRAPATRWSSAIAAVSHYVATHSENMGVPVHVVHNSVDLGAYSKGESIREGLSIDANCIIVTFAGQIREIKGVDLFVAASKRIVGEDVRFLIAGECRTGKAIGDAFTEEELLESIAADERIMFLGYREDMPDVYFSSDIVVVPSRWQEPFGLILLEAAAAKRPVVATKVGGIPEVVVDGKTGVLVEPGDIDALVRGIQFLIDDAEARKSMGLNAYAHVKSDFTDAPIRKLENLYASLIC